jgi:diadenosine tetraphosphate (Ap4A) HIT family hydrolase
LASGSSTANLPRLISAEAETIASAGTIVDAAMNNSNPPPAWTLHPQLEHDTVTIADLALSRLLVSHDANYPWLLLVPRCPGASEIIDLDTAEQAQLMIEIDAVSRALKAVTACDKLNIAAIVHVVARRRDDPAWPKAVWGAMPARAYDLAARERFIAALRRKIGLP